jgi:phosphohistidine phosphatase
MNIFILRHGVAVDAAAIGFDRDSDRPLTPKGERKLWKTAQSLEELEVAFDWIISSPYLRARQTAEIVAEAQGARKKAELTEHLTPAGSVKKLIEHINKRQPPPDNVLLVGHEPYLSDLISLLLSGNAHTGVVMKKGGLCKLCIDELEADRCATLEWLLTPKQLCLMA